MREIKETGAWMRVWIRGLLLVAVLLLCAAGSAGAWAAEPEGGSGALNLAIGEGTMLRLPRPSASVFIANPDVADIQVPSSGAIFVLGKTAGTTTLLAIDADNQTILRRTVVVRHNLTEMNSLLRQRFPSDQFELTSAPGSLMVKGTVDSAEEVAAVAATLTPLLSKAEKLINEVSVPRSNQVQLRVRVAEVSRDINQQFGFNWQALMEPGHLVSGIFSGRAFYDSTNGTGVNAYSMSSTNAWSMLGGYSSGHYSVQSMLDALDSEGLISILAEPNLTALSGQTASFLAGGEFPIPVAQSSSSGINAITVEFKSFGVALDFTPTVLSHNRISLLVRPEVSQLDTDYDITLNGTTIPGLSVRRAQTTVELASGQSFAVGGLLQENMTEAVSRFPGLASLPVLGKLFSSKNYQNNKSELVIIVTAYIVRPTDSQALHTPLQSLRPASDVEHIVQKQFGLDPMAPDAPRLMGQAGFVY
ncbi:type II secretion system protein D precursor [mine drainage metagenome]|uniref:Type II secretion system protein D n=1 Tax=mine drainage metagenome TaxID=410659 RepID=A0A1J5RE86_9ZZZZ